jgi:hypothetical protein
VADDTAPSPFDEQARNVLVERVAAGEYGAPLEPETARNLAVLKLNNRAQFETFRGRLRKAGFRVSQLDELIAEINGEPPIGGAHSLGQADILVALAEAAELFQTPDEEACADIEVNGHRETWSVTSRGFKRYLKRRFHEETGGAVTGEALASAIGVIEARALHDTEVRPVHVRVGEHDGKIYVDLCDRRWRALEIDKDRGWRIVERPEIRFRRTPDMRALPEPVKGSSIEALRPLLNIPAGEEGYNDFVLAIAYLLACLRGRGPYPIMVVTGEQGTAKSTRSALLRSVVDPGKPRLRALPRDERDLAISASRRHVLAFDNVSGLKPWMSDAFCRIASGAGFGTRTLYTDAEEIVFEGARPQVFNGIEDIVDRPDFAERSIFSVCGLIEKTKRRREDELWADFDRAHPAILGALLDAITTGLRRVAEIQPPELPRMADFAHWAIACETALWDGGTFMTAYEANILGAVESVLSASPVAGAVRALMDKREREGKKEPWKGTATVLHIELTALVDKRVAESESWPDSARALSGRLRRAASFLRQIGIHVSHTHEGHAWTRQTIIARHTSTSGAESFEKTSSAPSANGTGTADGADGEFGKLPLPEVGALLPAAVAYMRTHPQVSSPIGPLFRVLGQLVDDEDEDVMVARLKAIEGDLAKHGIMVTFERGWAVLEQSGGGQ